jgi:dolichol-phosphate mannosyltransferase
MLSIVVPVFNEEKNIISLLNQIKEHINIELEVLIIYDFDNDNTIPVIKENFDSFKRLNIKIIKNNIQPGVVNAVKKGINCASGKFILVLMADLSDDLSILNSMLKEMEKGYDIICGSRYMKGGKQIGGGRFKRFLSRLADLSLNFFTKIPTHDATNNFKLYRSSIFRDINIESNNGFEVALEITVKAYKKGYKITEVPTIWKDRTAGKSNFKLWKWLPSYLKWYFYCIFKKKY